MRIKGVLAMLLACFGALLVIGCSSEGNVEWSLEQSLSFACYDGEFDAVLDLLEQGADANGGEDMEGMPLFSALSEGYFTIAGILVDNGADVNVKFDDVSLLDTLLNAQGESDSEVDIAKLQLAIDWLYDNGAHRPPE